MRHAFLIFGLVLGACASATEGVIPPPPADAGSVDGGSVPADAGASAVDAGIPSDRWWQLIHVPEPSDTSRSNYQFVGALTVASDGTTIVGGRGVEAIEFGVPSTGAGYLYLDAIDALGRPQWVRRVGELSTTGYAQIDALAVGPAGQIYVGGMFRGGTLDLGDGPHQVAGASDIFIAAFDGSGAILWSMTRGGSGFDTFGALAADEGGVVAAAQVDGHLALLRISSAGEVRVDVRSPGVIALNGETCPATAVALAPGGDILVAGINGAASDFGGGTVQGTGFDVGWFVAFTSAGAYRWQRILTTDAGNPVVGSGLNVRGLLVRGDEVLLGGAFPGRVDFGGGPVDAGSSINPETPFVARYAAADGAFRGVEVLPAPSGLLGLSADNSGAAVATLRGFSPNAALRLVTLGAMGQVASSTIVEDIDPSVGTVTAAAYGPHGVTFALSILGPQPLVGTSIKGIGPYDSLIVRLPAKR